MSPKGDLPVRTQITTRECGFDSRTGHMSAIRYCPIHGSPDDVFTAWPCPMAVEGDPPETESCPHLLKELEQRIKEVVEEGNYFQYNETVTADGKRIRWVQEYRAFRPYGERKHEWSGH